MKHWIVYLIGLGLFLLLPKDQSPDISHLAPAEVINIYIEEDLLTVQTDTGNLGKGINLEQAIRDMNNCSAKQIFLETVSYVLVTEETKHLLPHLDAYLRPGTKPILVTAGVEVENVAVFLDHHDPSVRLCDCIREQAVLPKLMTAGERWYLVQ